MTKPLVLSARMANVLCIMLFVLPFFRQCEGYKMPPPPQDMQEIVQDSVVQADTLARDCTNLMSPPYTTEVVKEYPGARWLLMRGERDYTGFGMVVNAAPVVPFVGAGFTFLLLIVLGLIRLIDRQAWRSVIMLDVVVVALFFVSQPWWEYETLWGYWVVFWTAVAMLVADSGWPVYEWWQRRKRKKL